MIKTAIILSFFFFFTLSLTNKHAELQILWDMWKDLHGKSYHNSGEDTARFAIFVENYKFILDFNAKSESHKVGLNIFADLTIEEFKNLRHGVKGESKNIPQKGSKFNLEGDPPTSVDWRTKHVITPVYMQGQCGASWAIPVAECIEAMHAIKLNRLTSFSSQQILDCDLAGSGCDGGEFYYAFEYAAQYGLEPTNDYPYVGQDQNCNYTGNLAVKVNTGYVTVPPNNETALKLAIATMPTVIAVDPEDNSFQLYTSGVIQNCQSYSPILGGLAVGYGVVDGIEAYYMKNSWGTSWGEHGYVYISTDPKANNGTGVCGILSSPYYGQ